MGRGTQCDGLTLEPYVWRWAEIWMFQAYRLSDLGGLSMKAASELRPRTERKSGRRLAVAQLLGITGNLLYQFHQFDGHWPAGFRVND